MSVKQDPDSGDQLEARKRVHPKEKSSTKRRRMNGSLSSFMEISIDTSEGKLLKSVNEMRLKEDIKRWAKAVVSYARQCEGGFS